ncbi:NusG domain II-containing protein [Clostridium boliviensis]|uniref:NusG domain II-containing protein n=1 Tax=Clostridium boliviensis TaxID=318465 RepID=A0ABU4GMH0_9CLOT|nr:NusG domain II-containing protein [Clostridium boliviensis]MDW2798815.1 NusG domain II-containing protein [Clostridium boliviensis]
MEMKKHKKEVILIVTILAISFLLLIVNRFIFSKPARYLEITVDGNHYETLDLNQDTEILVKGYQGGTNRIVIQNGKVHVSDASCPDKICIHQGTIEQTGESIVCLPNRMIAQIMGK